MGLQDKRVLVIGGGSGIGFAVAEAALREGARVTVASSSAARVEAAVARLGQGADALRIDVADEGSVAAAFDAAGPLDHIVFTAGDWGGPRRTSLAEMDLAEAQQLFAIRFWGALRVAKRAAGVLPKDGSLTLTDGTIAHRPRKGSVVSTAMAGAVEHMTRALAVELAPIRVNCVCPAMIRTEVWNSIPEADREARFAEMTRRQLIPRIGEPAETAEAYLYLMKGGYTTGQVLMVEGGHMLGA